MVLVYQTKSHRDAECKTLQNAAAVNGSANLVNDYTPGSFIPPPTAASTTDGVSFATVETFQQPKPMQAALQVFSFGMSTPPEHKRLSEDTFDLLGTFSGVADWRQ